MSAARPVFTLQLSTDLGRDVSPASAYYTRDEARAAARRAFGHGLYALGDAPIYATIVHPDGTWESLEYGRGQVVDPLVRRARLLRFVQLYGDTDPSDTFRLRLGTTKIKWESLTDAALEDISADMVLDFWATKRRTRENRAGHARWAAEQASRLQAAE